MLRSVKAVVAENAPRGSDKGDGARLSHRSKPLLDPSHPARTMLAAMSVEEGVCAKRRDLGQRDPTVKAERLEAAELANQVADLDLVRQARISAKSRSNVTTMRLSSAATRNTSPSSTRARPRSSRCAASCPWSRSHEATRGETHMSTKNRIASRIVRGAQLAAWLSSRASQAAYSSACWMSSRSR